MLSKPGKATMPFFTPDKRLCLILGNYDYAAIRFGDQKEKGFADLPEVIQDMENFSQKIKQYGFNEDMMEII